LSRPTLVEAHIPAEFLRLLGAYLQTCAYIELEVAVTIASIEGCYLSDLSDEKHRFPAIRKLQTGNLIKRLLLAAENLSAGLKCQLLEVVSELESGKATRHTAVHGAFYVAEGQTALSVNFYHKGKETDFVKEDAMLDSDSTRQLLNNADEILRKLINIRIEIENSFQA
jgi:hypothetical protein